MCLLTCMPQTLTVKLAARTCDTTQLAENQWGVATLVREGLAEPMEGDDAKTASLAGKLYSDAVEQAQEPQHSAGGATVGQYLRKKWRQVLALHTSPLPCNCTIKLTDQAAERSSQRAV